MHAPTFPGACSRLPRRMLSRSSFSLNVAFFLLLQQPGHGNRCAALPGAAEGPRAVCSCPTPPPPASRPPPNPSLLLLPRHQATQELGAGSERALGRRGVVERILNVGCVRQSSQAESSGGSVLLFGFGWLRCLVRLLNSQPSAALAPRCDALLRKPLALALPAITSHTHPAHSCAPGQPPARGIRSPPQQMPRRAHPSSAAAACAQWGPRPCPPPGTGSARARWRAPRCARA